MTQTGHVCRILFCSRPASSWELDSAIVPGRAALCIKRRIQARGESISPTSSGTGRAVAIDQGGSQVTTRLSGGSFVDWRGCTL